MCRDHLGRADNGESSGMAISEHSSDSPSYSSFSLPPEGRQELEDELFEMAATAASSGKSMDEREAELLQLAISDTSD